MGEFVSSLGNPWLPAEWNVTRQGQFLQKYGMRRAILYAAAGGTTVGGTMYKKDVPNRVFIIQKRHIGGGGTTVLGGQGFTGDGPPGEEV